MRQHGALKRECRQRWHHTTTGSVGKHEGNFEALQMAKIRVYHTVGFYSKALLTDGFPRHSRRIQTHKSPLQIYAAGKTAEICNSSHFVLHLQRTYPSLLTSKL